MFRFVSTYDAKITGELPRLSLRNVSSLIRLFHQQHKTKDIVTLFHKASSPASVRVATLLKQASANATEHATEDQASDHSAQTTPHRAEFELNITEDPPTPDQLQTILQYVGKSAISSVVKGASSESEALKIFRQSAEAFQRPVVRTTHRPRLPLPLATPADMQADGGLEQWQGNCWCGRVQNTEGPGPDPQEISMVW